MMYALRSASAPVESVPPFSQHVVPYVTKPRHCESLAQRLQHSTGLFAFEKPVLPTPLP